MTRIYAFVAVAMLGLVGCSTTPGGSVALPGCAEEAQNLTSRVIGDISISIGRQCDQYLVAADNQDERWDYRCSVAAAGSVRQLEVPAGDVGELRLSDASDSHDGPAVLGCRIHLPKPSDVGHFERLQASWMTGEQGGESVLVVVNRGNNHLRCNLFDDQERPVSYVFGVPSGGSTARYSKDIEGWATIACGRL